MRLRKFSVSKTDCLGLQGEVLFTADVMDVDDSSNSTESTGDPSEGTLRAFVHRIGELIRSDKKAIDKLVFRIQCWKRFFHCSILIQLELHLLF